MTATQAITDFIERIEGPYVVSFWSKDIDNQEVSYGYINFIVTQINFSDENKIISFSNHNNTCGMSIIVDALHNPQLINEELMVFNYYNAVVPLLNKNVENWPLWRLSIEKYNPLAEYLLSGQFREAADNLIENAMKVDI